MLKAECHRTIFREFQLLSLRIFKELLFCKKFILQCNAQYLKPRVVLSTGYYNHNPIRPPFNTRPRHGHRETDNLDIGDISSSVQADLRVRATSEFCGLGAGRVALVSGADLLHVGDLGGFDGDNIYKPSALKPRLFTIYIYDDLPP